MAGFRGRTKLLTSVAFVLALAVTPANAQLSKTRTAATYLTVNGVAQTVRAGSSVTFVPGSYTVTLAGHQMATTVLALSGGGGGSTGTTGFDGAGGGGGAYVAALPVTLFTGKTYTIIVGAGGGDTVDGNPTSFVNTTDATTFLSFTGGGHGSNGATAGAGGAVTTGVGAVVGASGTGVPTQSGVAGGAGGNSGAGTGAGAGAVGNNQPGGAATALGGGGGGATAGTPGGGGGAGGNGVVTITF